MARISKPTSQPSEEPFDLPQDEADLAAPVRTGTAAGADSGPFLKQVRQELGRVTWPDRDHLTQATIVVLIVVLVSAAYLSALDALFSRLVGVVL